MHYPQSILNLIKNLAKLPGVGEKTAERLAMHILRSPRQEAEQLAACILDIRQKVRICSVCFALSETETCHVCSDPSRNISLLCVVEQPADMVAIEKSGSFKGLYHVLSGVLSPMNGVGPDNIRIRELIERTREGDIKEIIIATGTNVEGEATASYIAQCILKYPVKVTRIASGVPIGGDLKYVDQVTLRRAMETRHAV
ncbi:MAG: recombination protein RecR [Desulfobacteraceae bacterium]|nr:MAG: recombination protein RecR [Desulfobacteraceae bacterium]